MDNAALLMSITKERWLEELEKSAHADLSWIKAEVGDDPRGISIAITAYANRRAELAPEAWQADTFSTVARVARHSIN